MGIISFSFLRLGKVTGQIFYFDIFFSLSYFINLKDPFLYRRMPKAQTAQIAGELFISLHQDEKPKS